MLKGTIGNKALYDELSGSFRGEVKGVFSGGIYIFGEKTAVMLHDSAFGSLPFGIAIDGISGRGRELKIEPGMTAEASNGVLKLPPFETELSFAERARAKTSPRVIKAFIAGAESFLACSDKCTLGMYAHFGEICGGKEGIEDMFASAAYAGMTLFHSAMADNDGEKLSAALMKLLGLGRGLTPSCDDYITGVLFMLSYAEKEWGIVLPQRETLAERVLALADGRTNIYSALYLKSAASGGDFSAMRECMERPGKETVSRLGDVGSSSGTDMLCGMLFAAEMINNMI